jgi:hypothetical protein
VQPGPKEEGGTDARVQGVLDDIVVTFQSVVFSTSASPGSSRRGKSVLAANSSGTSRGIGDIVAITGAGDRPGRGGIYTTGAIRTEGALEIRVNSGTAEKIIIQTTGFGEINCGGTTAAGGHSRIGHVHTISIIELGGIISISGGWDGVVIGLLEVGFAPDIFHTGRDVAETAGKETTEDRLGTGDQNPIDTFDNGSFGEDGNAGGGT